MFLTDKINPTDLIITGDIQKLTTGAAENWMELQVRGKDVRLILVLQSKRREE